MMCDCESREEHRLKHPHRIFFKGMNIHTKENRLFEGD